MFRAGAGQHWKVLSMKAEFCVYVQFNRDSGQEFILFGPV